MTCFVIAVPRCSLYTVYFTEVNPCACRSLISVADQGYLGSTKCQSHNDFNVYEPAALSLQCFVWGETDRLYVASSHHQISDAHSAVVTLLNPLPNLFSQERNDWSC